MRARAFLVLCTGLLAAAGARALDYHELNKQDRQNVVDEIRKLREKRKKEEEKNRAKEQKKARARSLAELKKLLKKGEEEMKNENYSGAQSFFLAVESCTVPGATKYTSKAKTYIRQIEAMATAKLAEADVKHMLQRYVEEAGLLDEIVNSFAHALAAKKAKARMSHLKRDPRPASTMAYAKARAEEEAENYGEAVRLYEEIVRRWPDQVAALKAKVAVEKLKSDPEIAELIKEDNEFQASKVCPGWINIARNYLMNDDRDRARENLQRVIDEFPGTSYAEEARKMLEEL